MFYRTSSPIYSRHNTKQRGSALILVVFILVVVMLLGAALVQIQSSSVETITQEVLGTRALAAANSGAQLQLQILFPLASAPISCSNIDTVYNFSGVAVADSRGLVQCTATVNCDNYTTIGTVDYFRIISLGQCNSGGVNGVSSSRTVQVEARNPF